MVVYALFDYPITMHPYALEEIGDVYALYRTSKKPAKKKLRISAQGVT
jgi:hypothetical protein